jgi:hypothetical protein
VETVGYKPAALRTAVGMQPFSTGRSRFGPVQQPVQVMDLLSRPITQGLQWLLDSSPRPSLPERHRERGCAHDDCRCHCQCCVDEADLVVNTRLSERRIVPLEISNDGHRERNIRLELSGFVSRGSSQSMPVEALLSPREFTLKACQTQEVILAVACGVSADFDKMAAATVGTRPKDVDDCTVLYADLRMEGCDIRPVRIALAVLPRHCAPYEVHCRCGCC